MGPGSGSAGDAFAEENFSDVRLFVEPTRQQAQLIFQVAATLRGIRQRRGSVLMFRELEPFAQDLFDRPRLAGQVREAQHARLFDASGLHHKYGDGVLLSGTFKNDGVEVFESPREFRQPSQCFRRFLDAAMDRGGALEIERFAGRLALPLEFRGERGATRAQKGDDAAQFDVVFFFRASRKARREAHLHFGIHAAGIAGIAANLDLAAADFEQVEKPGSKCICRPA